MSNRTMKKKVVHRLPITTTHTTPIFQRATPKHQIIRSENPIMSSCPQKESHLLRNLRFPNTLPRKQRIRSTPNRMVVRPGLKLTITFQPPTKSISPITPRNTSLDKLKQRIRCNQLLVFKSSIKPQIPHSNSTLFWNPQNLRDTSILGS